MIDRYELRQAAAALDYIHRAGMLGELQERIAGDWSVARQRRLDSTLGYQLTLSHDLRSLLKADRAACDTAVDEFLRASYSRVALGTILKFAAELHAQRREPRPVQTFTSRTTRRPAKAG